MTYRASRRVVGLPLLGRLAALSCAVAALAPAAATAQIVKAKKAVEATEGAQAELRLGQPIATRFRVGARITAKGGTVHDIRTTMAVPLECPEQTVEMVEEDLTPNVEQFEYRATDEGVRQMLIGVPQLSPREDSHALVTFEVTTSPVLLPTDLTALHVPKKVDVKLKRYLGRSPYIDVNHRKIKQAVKEALAADDEATETTETKEDADAYEEVGPTSAAAADKPADDEGKAAEDAKPASGDADVGVAVDPIAGGEPVVEAAAGPIAGAAPAVEAPAPTGPPSADWTRIEKLYDYARKKVEYEEGEDQSSVQALAKGRGDCQAISALFVAMCRTEGAPARMVWADGHQYAEFYLEDAAGAGRWYPVESAGSRAFGEMPTARVILQKGDNFKVPERPRDRLRYASDYTLLLSKPGSQPKIAYVREQL